MLISFLSVGLLLSTCGLVRAEEAEVRERPAIDFQIGPTKSQLTLAPSASASGTFKVRNNGANEFDYEVYVRPYWVVDENYRADFDTERNWTQVTRWITLEKEKGHLATDEMEEIHYTVKVPADVPDGGQYAVIFVEAGLELPEGSNGIATRQRLGHLIYGRIDGTTREGGGVEKQEIKKFWWQGPVQATSVVENTGNVDFEVSYSLQAKNLWGKVREEVSRQYPVLPATKRLVTMELSQLAPVGVYRVTQEVAFLDTIAVEEKMVWVVAPAAMIAGAGMIIIVGVIIIGGRVKASRQKEWRKIRR
jgi:hypothetical protein